MSYYQVHQELEIKANVQVSEEGDYLTVVAARSRGLVAAGRRGIVYFLDPPDNQSKKK